MGELTTVDLSKTEHREATFRKALELLVERKPSGHLIVETGTSRQPNNWAGDGQSTLIWDDFCQLHGGWLYTIDLNRALDFYRNLCKKTSFYQMDSVAFLRGFASREHIDLIYLDSFDANGGPAAAVHQAAEFASVWNELPTGCIVMSDDCHGDINGKDYFVRLMMERIGVPPVISAYQTIWIKP